MIAAQTFDACGERWTLLLGNAAQCAVEEQYDRGFFGVIADALPNIDPSMLADPAAMVAAMSALRVSVLRDLAWHGLRKHHPDITLADVSDIIDDLGQAAFGTMIGAAIRSAQGAEVAEEGAKGEGVTRKRGRTGTRS